MPGVWRFGLLAGHLTGPTVSALVDGQLDEESSERAWAHVLGCSTCRDAVGREGWVKRQVAQMSGYVASEELPATLLGSLYDVDARRRDEREAEAAWATVGRLEERGRLRRRAGIAAVGVGSVSAAVFGLTALSGSTLGIGGTSSGPPPSALARSTPTTGPLAHLGRTVETTRTATRRPAPSGVSAPSSFVPFSGWSISAPVELRGSAALSARAPSHR